MDNKIPFWVYKKLDKESSVKSIVKGCLKKAGIYLLLVIGIGLLLSPMLESAVVEIITNRYLLQNYTAAQIAGNTAQAQYTGIVIEEDIAMQDLTSILPYISDIDQDQVIGAIAIPSVGLYQPIFSGTTKANLIAGAGTMKDGQVMGKGNYCLAGHHMKDETLLFGPLSKVKVGDWVQLTDKTKLYTYEVTKVEIIHQSEVEVLEDTQTPTVTLITCEESGVNTNYRLMVKGTLIDNSPVEQEIIYTETIVQEQEKIVNEYLEVFQYLTTTRTTNGIYRLWLWIIVVLVSSALLLWIGYKILKISEKSNNKSDENGKVE